MSEKFKDIYRIESARLQNWDYGWNAPYFVTICTANRECYFGKIDNGKMILSDIGKIAEKEWIKTPEIRPDMNIRLGAYCVMPNHFHGIIIIGQNEYNAGRDAMHRVSKTQLQNNGMIRNAIRRDTMDRDAIDRDAITRDAIDRDARHGVSTTTTMTSTAKQNRFEPQRKNLASIVRGFKSAVTMYACKNKIDFAWQTRFHDHIIRDDESHYKIQQYIENNAMNWQDDKFYIM